MSKEREITIELEEVMPDLEERAEIVERGREITEKMEELHQERKELGLKAQKLQDKIQDPIEEEVEEQTELSEFEYMASVKLENDDIVVTIADQLEEIKEKLREKDDEEALDVELEE